MLWDALGMLWDALGTLWDLGATMMVISIHFYIHKLPINRPRGRYVRMSYPTGVG